MILIGLGANLESEYGQPIQTLTAASLIFAAGMDVIEKSRVWLTEPYPKGSDQPWYHNAVIQVETDLSPEAVLDLLLNIEQEFGRVRTHKNAPRVIDLDLIAYNEQVFESEDLIIPHPRMHERSFVLKPLSDINQNWIHPLYKKDVRQMIEELGESASEAEPLEDAW